MNDELPFYATYLYWLLFAMALMALALTFWNITQTYKLQKAVEVIWNATILNPSFKYNMTAG